MSATDRCAGEREAVAYLRTPEAIRERSENVFARGLDDQLEHFSVRLDRLPAAAERVAKVTRAAYPDLKIPCHSRWSHFQVGGVDRLEELERKIAGLDRVERARCRIDLVVTSVLLDAGAGAAWNFYEESTGHSFSRSEGLAVASFRLFLDGGLSSSDGEPLRADAAGLVSVTEAHLARAFQVSDDNPLVGLAGRAALMRGLGDALRAAPEIFGAATPRVGGLLDHLWTRAARGLLPAAEILGAIIEVFSTVWPSRTMLGDVNLGDVWPHPAAGGTGPGAGLVPFHKLSQWLTYSLIEPLEEAGLQVVELDALTGLPEYRNGGLFLDTGVLEPKHADVTGGVHLPSAEVVVEWRALTVALLDRVASGVREILGLDRSSLPLARVLEGGTWRAGREVARERRPDGAPPIRIESDGTVF